MWKIIQCAVQGREHIKTGTPCQDKIYSLKKNGVSVMSLADGAGFSNLSHFGAERITQFICNEFSKNFDIYFSVEDGVLVKKELILKIKTELEYLSEEMHCEIDALSSTLMVIAVKETHFILLHIGDGVIGYLKNDELKIASHPDNGEFINTTFFTTSTTALSTMKLIKGNLGDIQGFVMMSDGAEYSLYNKQERMFSYALKKIMNLCVLMPQEKMEIQLYESFNSVVKTTTTDDCSIAFMVNSDFFSGYRYLNKNEKSKLLGVNILSKRQLKRYDSILEFLENGKTLKNIAKMLYLKPKYSKKYIERLLRLGLIEKKDSKYYALIMMDEKSKR